MNGRCTNPTIRLICIVTAGFFLFAAAGAAKAQQSGNSRDYAGVSADALFDYANDRFAAGDHETALYEFKRFAWFFPKDARIPRVFYKCGRSFFEIGRYDAALSYYKKTADQFPESEYALESRFAISRCLMKKNNPDAALRNLYRLAEKSVNPEVKDRAYYRLAWICLETEKVGQAHVWLSRISPAGRERFRVETMLAKIEQIASLPGKSPFWAGIFSIIPGGGYLYCGRYQDAAIAFSLNAVLIGAACEAFDNDLEVLGSAIVLVDTGFYAGSIYGGISSAHKYNRARYDQFINKIKSDGFSLDCSLNRGTNRGAMLSLKYRF